MYNLSFRTKIILPVVGVVFAFVTLSSYYYYSFYSNRLLEQSSKQTQQIIDQASTNISNYIDEKFLEMDIKQILDKPKKNSKDFLKIKKEIKKKCKDFIKKCEKDELNIEKLPEIENYKKYSKKLSWYKDIYEKERLIVEKIEQKRVEEYNLYHKNLEK